MKNMEKLFEQLIEKAKQDKYDFLLLKNTVVKLQQFELAAQLREIERNLFPESDEEKKAKEIAKEIKTLLSMVDLNAPDATCFIISETLRLYDKKKGEFTLEDAVRIKVKCENIFQVKADRP
jgi:hypothetical protein